MNLPKLLLALCMLPLCVPGGASAQVDKEKWGAPIDLKQLLPPVVPVPRNYQLTPGAVGETQGPNTFTPLQNPAQSSPQAAPGIKLTIPTR
jgi:hypothetical protein